MSVGLHSQQGHFQTVMLPHDNLILTLSWAKYNESLLSVVLDSKPDLHLARAYAEWTQISSASRLCFIDILHCTGQLGCGFRSTRGRSSQELTHLPKASFDADLGTA